MGLELILLRSRVHALPTESAGPLPTFYTKIKQTPKLYTGRTIQLELNNFILFALCLFYA